MQVKTDKPLLSDTQIQQIKAEEECRNLVRKELERSKSKTGFWGRIFHFLENSKIGFGMSSAIGVILLSSLATWLNGVINASAADVQKKRDSQERSRRDIETMLQLIEPLTAEKEVKAKIAAAMLTTMKDKTGVDKDLIVAIEVALANQSSVGSKSATNSFQREIANTVAKKEDIAALMDTFEVRPDKLSNAKIAPSSIIAPRLESNILPIRVYIQIANDSQRIAAEKLRTGLINAQMLSPDIEIVGKKAPVSTSIRYCAGRAEVGAPKEVQVIVDAQLAIDKTPLFVLPEKLCGNVRFNHFEVWFNETQK
jgi:hypothetical protein